ncbi:MAG TPA: ABC transporter permease [Microbacteriaceae bacterium]|nr:ABC transporter permease [Microbacteriaceae bacterium]
MFATYLARELGKRRKQTAIIAVGLALAVALVMIVSAISAGVRDAQAEALEAVYGVGTDLTVTQAATAPTEGGGPQMQFDFGGDAGTATDEGSREISTSRLEVARGTTAFDASAVDTAAGIDGVAAAAGSLTLQSTTFSGELPTFTERPADGSMPGMPGGGGFDIGGGADGAGGSSFGIESMTVTGIDLGADGIGPLTSTTVTDGRALEAADAGADVAVLDSDYATTASLAVGDTIELGGTTLQVVGIAQSTATSGAGADAYIPLGTAQTLADLDGQVTTVYVQAASAESIDAIATDLAEALPEATVNTQSELASTVSGSLSSASSLISNLGTWLSAIVLAAAFVIAILFTVSGVTRRTREFGTLKAIGWRNSRIVGQVAGESLVTGAIGVVAGVVIGIVGIVVVNAISPTIAVGGGAQQGLGGQGGFAGPGGRSAPGAMGEIAQAAAGVTLNAVVTPSVILIAVGFALLGAVLAGVFGGWRAACLRPAAALRTVE